MNYDILIINYYYPPVNNGGVNRIKCFKKYLSRQGFTVSIITTSSFGICSDDKGDHVYRFPDPDIELRRQHMKLIGLCFKGICELMTRLGLITDVKYFWKKKVFKQLDHIIHNNDFKFVIASYPASTNLEIGEAINKKYHIPLIVDYRDGIGYEPFPWFYSQRTFLFRRKMNSLERSMSELASLQIVVNKGMAEYYTSKYPDVETIIIENGFDDEDIVCDRTIPLPSGINVLYTGSLSLSRELYSMRELSEILNNLFRMNQRINYVFIGDYNEQEKAVFSKYDNVYCYHRVGNAVVTAIQKEADALLLISGATGSTSGKFYEYLFAQKPILNIGGNEGVGEIINGTDFGITCMPEDMEAISDFLSGLSDKSLKYNYPYLEKYTRRFQCEVLGNKLKTMIK